MCELTVYALKGNVREKIMDGVVRLIVRNQKVLMEGILGDSIEIEGRIIEVDIMAQSANIITS